MANLDNPHGLNAVRMMNGGKIPMDKYTVNATTAIYQGDVVQIKATGLVRTIVTTGGAASILGVAANYTSASGEVWVYNDPGTVFEIQSDGTTDPSTAAAARAHIGETAVLILTAGNTTTKVSKQELDYSSMTTGTADPLQIIGFHPSVDNDNTLAHARYLVLLKKNVFENVPESYSVI